MQVVRIKTVFSSDLVVPLVYEPTKVFYRGNSQLAGKLKLGRNDPCPCGSGKKYKNCCGRLGDITPVYEDPFTHYSQLITSFKVKLESYFAAEVKKHRQSIKSRFARFSVIRTIRNEHESIFSDWLWFDLRDDEEMTMAGRYFMENEAFMEKPLRECLQALNQSYLSVYRLTGSMGLTLSVSDIFSGSSYKVMIKEPFDLEDKDRNMLALGRIICLPDVNLFSGLVLMLENDLLQEDFIKEHLEYLQSLAGLDLPQLLKSHGEILYGIYDHAGQKMLLNLNDMRIRLLDDNERERLLGRLAQDSDYKLQHTAAGCLWYKAAAETAGYSRLIVADNLVLSASDVLEDVMEHSRFLDTLCPNKPVEVINSLMLPEPPDPQYSWLWFLVLKDRESEKWLSTPHRELEGKTPDEVLQQPDGASTIIAMLDTYQDSMVMEEEKDIVEYIKLKCLASASG